MKNAKTMFRVMSEFKKNTGVKNNYTNQTSKKASSGNGPTFFL